MTSLRKLSVAAVLIVLGTISTIAHADASCTSLLTSKYNYLSAHGGWWGYELTISGDGSGQDVRYTRGALTLSAPYMYDGGGSNTFSDRYDGYSNGQNFSVHAPETIRVWLDQSGDLWIYDNNYSYWLLNNGNMSCSGGVVTKYVNGAVFTLAFRAWGAIL